MATSQPTEMQVESEISIQEAVKELVEIEVEEDKRNPFEGMNNAQITAIYHRMKPEDRRLFRLFKKFHKLYFNLHGHDTPSHHLNRGIISKIFSGLPARDRDTIANARAELLAAERLKDLCKQLGLAFPVKLQTYRAPSEALEYLLPPHHCIFLHDRIRQNKWPRNHHNSSLLERPLLKQISNQT